MSDLKEWTLAPPPVRDADAVSGGSLPSGRSVHSGTRKDTFVMGQITVVYWRDIPAQVIAGKGRRAAKVQLSERFEQAIDRAAMRTGAADSDAYLADWRKVPGEMDGEDAENAAVRAASLEAEWPRERLQAVALAGGHETSADQPDVHAKDQE